MTSPLLRIIALVLLILSFAMFTGIVTTVSALERPERIDACCDRGSDDSEPVSDPCSDSDCLCFSCLTFTAAEPLLSAGPLQVGSSAFLAAQTFYHDGFSEVIDYPPEIA